ncbi:hypothetical protein DQ04_02111030 [Trypanosoma grayi]|uniref:hypothetical protein n=1 Tax=Trypanosoma grayi TaxID=71804 RepID=UPI0004F447C4|nr:hypothetical protein DQ04_02111030 [Trypanosoma grayi]KEG11961.1 hypothetical protein DQ04_02111030 [Trypanosoma grayi]
MRSHHKRYRYDGEDPHNSFKNNNNSHYSYEDSNDNLRPQPRVRYSDLTPEAKLQKRRQERQEKKEKERTLSYFISVQRALDEQAAGAGDASTLATIVDGFFVELIKLLKADPSLHLLRNGAVCRVIESALANSLLLHSKSLLYVLLGHVFDTVTSPTASYMMETLMVSLAQALSALADDAEAFDAEMADGGPGVHAGSGVPSAATLVTCLVDELVERAGDIIMHEVGARAVRSIVLVLGGFTIRGAPPLQHTVKFAPQLGVLGGALMQTLEHTFSDSRTQSAVDVWLGIASTPTASFILQNLLRVCEFGTSVDVAVRQRLESCDGKESLPLLLRQLLMDPLGCHIFQAYVKVPAPPAVLEACDMLANRKAAAVSAVAVRTSANERRLKRILRDTAGDGATENDGEVNAAVDEQTCWDKALDVVVEALDELLDPAEDRTTQATYALQDLVLFAPTELHLQRMWEQLLKPRLQVLLPSPLLVQVLVVFARKCAFAGVCGSPDNKDDSEAAEGAGGALPKDVDQLLRGDVAQGVRYFAVSADFQKTVVTTLCFTMKQLSSKGAAQYLLVDGGLREKGFELSRYLLHFNTSASGMFVHSMDKLCLSDIEALLQHAKGSLVLQQYLRAAAISTASAGAHASSRTAAVGAAPQPPGNKSGEQLTEKSVPLRFLRRIKPLLPELVGNTYAAFVVEVLYEVASLEVKEELVKLLVPIYNTLRRGAGDAGTHNTEEQEQEWQQGGDGVNAEASTSPQVRAFIARKVMTNCCVELYLHRPQDWAKLAHRQCQVQRLLQRMSAVSS